MGGQFVKNFSKEDIEKSIPGYWYREPQDEEWAVETVAISRGQLSMETHKRALFIAIDIETWHKGSKNTGIYSGWTDTHKTVSKFQHLITGLIVQKPIAYLDEHIPQYVTENTYEAISLLANFSFNRFQGKTIGITGTAGKSTTKNILRMLLEKSSTVESTRGNHNTRTGVPLTVACAITDPDYLIVESAISGLWMKPEGIMKNYPPDIALITSIDGGQNKDALETAKLKAKIAEGMNDAGIVVINKEAKEFQTLVASVEEYTSHIITYGWDAQADSNIISYAEKKGFAEVQANILGEEVAFQTSLLGENMALNIVGVLTVLKKLGIPLYLVTDDIASYQASQGVQEFIPVELNENESFTLLDDSWNATGIAMIEAIRLFHNQSIFYTGKKIAILGRIENLGDKKAKRQHEALVEPLIQSDVDIVFAHGPEMKYLLAKLPETLIGGYYDNIDKLMEAAAPLIESDSFVLLKGSPRSSDFKYAKESLFKQIKKKSKKKVAPKIHPYATGAGAVTFAMETNQIVGMAGNIHAEQNQGLGNVLLISEIMQRLFAGKLKLSQQFTPGKQEINENRSLLSLPLKSNEALTLHTILTAAIVRGTPNMLLMLANQVIGSNKEAVQLIREKTKQMNIPREAALNLTGRRIPSNNQTLTLPNLYEAAKKLFDQFSKELSLLSQPLFAYKGKIYKQNTNLFSSGKISHGLFYGYLDSIGMALSHQGGKKLITVVLGATDPYERDQLIINSLESVQHKNEPDEQVERITKEAYKMTIIGDTYFGEFYTDIRKKHGKVDALQKYGRNYSFDKIRPLMDEGDYTICNFEAAISNATTHPLKASKPFILYADSQATIPALKKEKIDLVTLGNNHLMDCGIDGLQLTLNQLNNDSITKIGAGLNQEEAEKPHIKEVNGQRVAIFSGYWYRNPMYYNYDFYALGNKPGVACLSGNLRNNIQKEKEAHPDGLIIVIPHWGADFQTVSDMQRAYAYAIMDAGADVIIGHGAHMMQEIEKYHDKYIIYSIGNGVFNSNGEYNRRHVPPYSFIVQLIQHEQWELRLYPIYTNNLKTFWQPRFVDEAQFKHCEQMLKTYRSTLLEKRIDNKSRNYFEIIIE